MKTILLAALVVLGSTSAASAADTRAYGFPPMAAGYLNRMLTAALSNMGCVVSRHLGVQGDARHKNGAPGSCHNIARAIDIASLRCQNNLSNEENLRKLAGYFTANPFILICYKDIGPLFTQCRGSHGGHLHFGGREALRCSVPLPF